MAAVTFGGFCKGEVFLDVNLRAPPTTLPVVMTLRAAQTPSKPPCILCDASKAAKLKDEVTSIAFATYPVSDAPNRPPSMMAAAASKGCKATDNNNQLQLTDINGCTPVCCSIVQTRNCFFW